VQWKNERLLRMIFFYYIAKASTALQIANAAPTLLEYCMETNPRDVWDPVPDSFFDRIY